MLDDRDPRTEPAVHLRKFESDIAAAHHEQMLGEDNPHPSWIVGQERDIREAGQSGTEGLPPTLMKSV